MNHSEQGRATVDVRGPVFRTSPLTCTIDGLAHLVSDDAAAAGVAARRGTYAAVCGHTVHAAALVCSAGRPCPRCAVHFDAYCAAADAGPGARRTQRRRQGGRQGGRTRLQRLLGQLRTLGPSESPRPSLGASRFSTRTEGTSDRLERRTII